MLSEFLSGFDWTVWSGQIGPVARIRGTGTSTEGERTLAERYPLRMRIAFARLPPGRCAAPEGCIGRAEASLPTSPGCIRLGAGHTLALAAQPLLGEVVGRLHPLRAGRVGDPGMLPCDCEAPGASVPRH